MREHEVLFAFSVFANCTKIPLCEEGFVAKDAGGAGTVTLANGKTYFAL